LHILLVRWAKGRDERSFLDVDAIGIAGSGARKKREKSKESAYAIANATQRIMRSL
jgi:hypothetical protein